MNKKLVLAKWLIWLVLLSSVVMVIHATYQLWHQQKVEAFVAAPALIEAIPDDARAHFALAAMLVEQQDFENALDHWTQVLSYESNLTAKAYYNRGNVNLNKALALTASDGRQIPLIELAKQDFRSTLAINPDDRAARYNLEVALRVVPEDPDAEDPFEKKVVNSQRSIESKAFKVDLP
jgi:mxaK protein